MSTQHQHGPILVTGGTGTLGRHVVSRLRDGGHDVRVLTRGTPDAQPGVSFVTGDLDTGEGVEAALRGAETIIHCAGATTGDGEKAEALVRAASAAAIRHLVHISVVGTDRMPISSALDRAMFGYFASKRDAEEVVEGSGLPWTILRATQFHDLLLTMAQGMAKLPVVPVPSGFRFQPVDAGDVAGRLVELALGVPAGYAADLAGPQEYALAELVRSYLRAAGKHRLLVPVRVPGAAARAYRNGANLATSGDVGTRTWEAFLADRVGAPATAGKAAVAM